MDKAHGRELTSPMQAQNAQMPQSDLLIAIIMLGGGMMPQTGEFSVSIWSRIFGVSTDTVNEWIDRYKVRHRKPGKERYVDAPDWKHKLPIIDPAAETKPKRGAGRKKG